MHHIPVLLTSVLEAFSSQKGGIFIDATYGLGGHSRALLSFLEKKPYPFRLLAIDRDPLTQSYALKEKHPFFNFIPGNFAQIDALTAAYRQGEKVQGVLFDLGVSSMQLDQAQRGFSFSKEGPLDMRMNPSEGILALQWLKQVSLKELTDALKYYGEERHARKIGSAIKEAVRRGRLVSTLDLARLVQQLLGPSDKKHPATRTFQAIRMALNEEVPSLCAALQATATLLAPSGRCVVLTFHGVEVRILRGIFCKNPLLRQKIKLVARILPSPEEVQANRRSRSAMCFIFEKNKE